MQIQLLSTEIDVVPLGRPRLSYFLSILRFDTSKPGNKTGTANPDAKARENLTSIYSRLRKGMSIHITSYSISPYEREIPDLLQTELPLLLKEIAQDKWQLTMQHNALPHQSQKFSLNI